MRKKSLSWLLTTSMVLSMLASGPISAAALEPESGVCKIEETDYATLADALNQVTSGQTITLLGDIEHHANIWVGTTSGYGPSFTLDLNDHTLTVSNTEVPLAALDGCSLSVVDDSAGGGGVLQLEAAAGESAPTGISAVGAGSRVSVAADVTASITAAGSNSRGIYVGNGGAVEIGAGTVTGELYGVFADSNGSAAIHGNVTGNATFSSAGVYVQNNATVTVTGTVTGAYYGAISAYGGLADITGNVTADTNGLTVEYGGLAEVEGEIRGSAALYVRNGVGWDAPHVSIVGDVTSTGTTAMNVIEAADIEVTGTITGCIDVSGGITVTVNSAICDEQTLYLTIHIEAPEGVKIDMDSEEGNLFFEKVKCESTGIDTQTGHLSSMGRTWFPLEDGDGKENTATLLMREQYVMSADSNRVYTDGEIWRLELAQLQTRTNAPYYDEVTTLTEGGWSVEFPLTEMSGEVEMISSPVVCVAQSGGEMGSKESVEMMVDFFVLRPFSVTLRYSFIPGNRPEAVDILDIYLVMKDGSTVTARPRSGGGAGAVGSNGGTMSYMFDAPVMLDEVAYVVLPDDVQVPFPEK